MVKWKVIAKPNDIGGWGLNNVHHIGRALAAKVLIFKLDSNTWVFI
jgi:hypothetical protein